MRRETPLARPQRASLSFGKKNIASVSRCAIFGSAVKDGLKRMKKLSRQIAKLGLLGMLGLVPHMAVAKNTGPTLTDVALEWSRGRYVTPMICKIEGEALRAQRRALIAPGEKKYSKTLLQVRFYRMQLPAAPSNCFSVLGVQEFDMEGGFVATVVGKSRADSLERDFKEMLERKGGIELVIEESQLRLFSFENATQNPEKGAPETATNTPSPAGSTKQTDSSQPTQESVDSQHPENTATSSAEATSTDSTSSPQEVQVKSARLSTVARGSDLARTLADYQDFPQYQLDLELSDGRFLTIPLVKTGLR